MKQRDVFLQSEGDAWFRRNRSGDVAQGFPRSDPLLTELVELAPLLPPNARVLEIGCGDGARLAWLSGNCGCRCSGIDPSAEAVAAARRNGVDAEQGTADSLRFPDGQFDVVMFGFCLYVCDRADLFRIAAEADRVLLTPGWMLILDFFSPAPVRREYHHQPGLFSYKMDYRELFAWHPSYVTYTQKVRHHEGGGMTDEAGDWVATSVLRKLSLS